MANRPTTYEERMQIIQRHINGESLPKIAQSLGVHKDTARKWWRKYKHLGWNGLVSRYGRKPKGALASFHSLIKYVVLRLKIEHPAWGLDLLLLHMSRRSSLQGKKLPKRTSLHNYLQPYYHRFRPRPRYPTTRPQPEKPKLTAVHQRWQMDFKGCVKIKGLGRATPFNLCDEYSSAPLQGVVYSQSEKNPLTNVGWRDIQHNLRQAFEKWGKPLHLRMDRDPIFIGSSRFEWPGSLLLWLVGLGIQPIVNRKATPSDNSNVERTNLTWLNHVGITTLAYSREQLQQQTDQAWIDRRRHLPSRNPHCNNLPPMVAMPELKHSNRPYSAHHESQIFNMDLVYEYLSKWKWKRQVDTHGRISIGQFQRAISKDHIGQIVKVLFATDIELFQVFDLNSKWLKSFSLPSVSIEFLTQNGGAT